MAMMDDRKFLISHIRNSFITSDDTGMCELIIDCDENTAVERHLSGDQGNKERHFSGTEKRPTTWHGANKSNGDSSFIDSGVESDTELSHSFDILPDMDFSSHRRRSNTAQRLEKLKREKHKQSKIKHVPWKDVKHQAIDAVGEYFEKKTLPPRGDRKRQSLLSRKLEQCGTRPNNPFMDYARFDGRTTAGLATKKIDIFLTMAGPDDRGYPMTVVTLTTAKVHDLIGLICWQYVNEDRQPPLKEMVEAYALHIAEDDGEADMDFPALDNREPIQKFGFAKLALVERDVPQNLSPKTNIVVTVNLPNRGFSKIPVDSKTILMRDILDKVLKKRKMRQTVGLEHMLEKQSQPGQPVNLDSALNDMDTLEFFLIRANSARGDVEPDDIPRRMSEMAESLTSHQYRSYIVSLSHKLRTNTDVQLGISGEKIEIDPVTSKSKIPVFKTKATTYDTESIAACNLLETKSSGRATFRLVYQSSHDFGHHDFESDAATAKEIVQKVNNILEMRSSPVRKDYIAHQERKLKKRHTLAL